MRLAAPQISLELPVQGFEQPVLPTAALFWRPEPQ